MLLKLILFIAVALSIRVSATPDISWWRDAHMYEVFPRSFKDSDGDGLGDINGITERADYLRYLGVTAIWITPIFRSPMVDMGYDISNYTDIAPEFGTMDDFDRMMAKMNASGIRVVLDFVINHSSDQHPWFQASRDPSHPQHERYKDYYVWLDPNGTDSSGKPLPPNNWISVFEGSAWAYNTLRKQFYLHQFATQQPDLNLRNSLVVGEILDIMRFWCNKGIAGFRLDAVHTLFENSSYPSEPVVPGTNGSTFRDLQHIYTRHQKETFDFLNFLSLNVYNITLNDGIARLMILEQYSDAYTTRKYYGGGITDFQIPFNFVLLRNTSESSLSFEFKDVIKNSIDITTPPNGTSNWVLGTHDVWRVSYKYGSEMVDPMNMLASVLPGIKITYYGEEIGMTDTFVREDRRSDYFGNGLGLPTRDICRTPMQWDDSPNAGFSSNRTTWLPVNPNYWWLNVEIQTADNTSHLNVFRAVLKARESPALKYGALKVLAPNNDTLVIVRSYVSLSMVLVINLGYEINNYSMIGLLMGQFESGANVSRWEIQVASGNSGYGYGKEFDSKEMINLRPRAAVLLKNIHSASTPSSMTLLNGHPIYYLTILALNVYMYM